MVEKMDDTTKWQRPFRRVFLMGRLASLVVFAAACSAPEHSEQSMRNPLPLKGWACLPDKVDANMLTLSKCVAGKKPDFYYFHVAAATTDRRPGPPHEQCRDAARLQLSGVFASSIMPLCPSGVIDSSYEGLQRQTKLSQQVTRLVSRSGRLFGCCALDPQTGRCARAGSRENWTECFCLAGVHYPQGPASLEALGRRLGCPEWAE